MKFNLTTILLIIISVLVTLQVKSCFEKPRLDEKIIEDRVKLKQYEAEFPQIQSELTEINRKYDSLLSASADRYNELEKRKQPIYNAIKQVPVIVGNFDKEQFSRAITAYYEKYK